jgi:hypothetical protein
MRPPCATPVCKILRTLRAGSSPGVYTQSAMLSRQGVFSLTPDGVGVVDGGVEPIFLGQYLKPVSGQLDTLSGASGKDQQNVTVVKT